MTTKVVTLNNTAKLKPTHNPLPVDQRAQAIGTLNNLIADMLDVSMLIRHIRWNLVSTESVSNIFEPAFHKLDEKADLLAQRVVALGGFVPATAKKISQDSSIEDFPAQPLNEEAYKNAIIVRLGQLARSAGQALHNADNIHDPVTSYHLTEAAVAIERELSIFERHLAPRA